MYNLVLVLTIIVCVLLTLIVLIQNPKGGGIAASYSAGNQIMGVKRTNEVVEKLTWGLAIALLILSLSSNLFVTKTNSGVEKSVIQDKLESGDLPDGTINAFPGEDVPEPVAE